MRSFIAVIGFAISALISTSSSAGIVTNTLPACISKELLTEFVSYSTRGDREGMMQLIMTGDCVILKPGERVSVISPGFVRATIRYRGIKMYTPAEAVK